MSIKSSGLEFFAAGIADRDIGDDTFHRFPRDIRRVFQILAELIVGVVLNVLLLYPKIFLHHPLRRGLLVLKYLHAFGIGSRTTRRTCLHWP